MKGIVIRFTENKREVGIPKTSSQTKDAFSSLEGEAGGKCAHVNKEGYVSLKFKCFEKYRSFNGKISLPDKETQREPDLNNNEGVSAIRTSRELLLNKVVEKGHSKWGVSTTSAQRKSIRIDSILENESNNKTTVQSKKIKRLVKLNRGKSSGQAYLKHPSIKSAVKKFIKDLKNKSSDEKSKRKHPNRRLVRERPENDLPAPAKRVRLIRPRSVVVVNNQDCTEPPVPEGQRGSESESNKEEKQTKSPSEGKSTQGGEESQTDKSKHVASGMWEKVLDSPHMWEEETSYIRETYDLSDTDSDGNGSAVDYTDLLEEFVLHNLEENRDGGKTLYEKRVKEMLEDPNCINLVKEFYIPPALVEVLFHKMAQDQTAEESLRRICEARKWPEPEFTCKWSGRDGFLYSCTLKTKTFIATKPASNEDLAKELAALECLEWLGFQQRSSLGTPSLKETYFP